MYGKGRTKVCLIANTLNLVFQLVPQNQAAGNELEKFTRVLHLAIKGERIKITPESCHRDEQADGSQRSEHIQTHISCRGFELVAFSIPWRET